MTTNPLTGSTLDLFAIAWFALVVVLFRYVGNHQARAGRGIIGSVQAQRVQWMLTMARRDSRIVDGAILQALSAGNAFFASTSAIAVGGLMTLVGTGDKAQAFVERLPFAGHSPPEMWDVKLALLMGIFVFAFFKFAWAFRLSHYCGIMIGATPIPDGSNQEACDRHALRAAALIGIAAEHANSGLRSFYYAIATLGWFYHPALFIVATAWVALILVRRDFFSRSSRILAEDVTPQ